MRRLYKTFSGNRYETILNDRKRDQLSGDWKLIVGDTTYLVETTPAVTILRDKTNDYRMRIQFESNNVISLKPSGSRTPFFPGESLLVQKTTVNGNIVYVGRTEENKKIILRGGG